ncbi:MAG: hypothetical protein UX80_C0032G0012 [Candidatus Amesbacteria bacterium GW2011_GWA2_47_11b]|uniref:Uncharacterized protein n=1 Tax=Candidatus Amesbacteria bacterium GW2011_GWA2_47_11b TaxID=1618358 RepID=A0A0G1UG75_9BACT|nr:MAG: hypothetical protein UX80_C0032G0012 [Candidatus Amesbacteria bacterium GW2011_GWA2_47_11b]
MANGDEVRGKVPEEVVKKIMESDPLVKDSETEKDVREGTVPPDRGGTTKGTSGGSRESGGGKGKG